MGKKVAGIIIDFPAAKDIYARSVPSEIGIIANLRANDKIYFAPEEESLYSKDPVALQVFGNKAPEYLSWSELALTYCDKISQQVAEHRFLGQNRLPMCLAALAKGNSFGVISGTKHPSHFVSPAECCKLIGVHCWTVPGFYAEFGTIVFT